jgi:PAS domain S-box-containing protein
MLSSAQPTLLLWGSEQTLLFNDAYARTLGARYLEILGKPFTQVAAPIWDRISPLVDDGFAGRSGVLEDVEIPTWRSGFTEMGYYSFAYTPLFLPADRKNPIGLICKLTDRTKKVAFKKRLAKELDLLHEVYEHAPGFIAMAEGPEHRFTFANAAYRELIGREDLIGRTVSEVMPEIQRQGFVELLDRVYQTGVPFIGRGLPIEFQHDPDVPPAKRFIDTIYHPVRDADGAIVGLFAEGHDVTEHVQAESLAGKLQAQLLRVSRFTAMESFGSAVAHEINQPLAAAVNYLAIARKLVGSPDKQEDLSSALERASSAAMRAGDILRRLRTLTATGTSNSQPTDLVKTVLEAITLVRMANPNISVITTSLEGAVVMADAVQIQQVLVNLLRNAQDAMVDNPHPEVEISVTKNDWLATVRVEDRGPGIPKEKLPELFDWFMTTKSDGTGIGLPISQRIIEAHSGRIWAENSTEGAVFKFTLPLAREGIEQDG